MNRLERARMSYARLAPRPGQDLDQGRWAALERWLGEEGRAVLADVRAALSQTTAFDEQAVGGALEAIVQRRGVKPREVYQPLRVAISGTTVSPGIFESVALLGREETLRRIDAALQG